MGFIAKLWRGEISLGTTYWIFGAVVVFMFQVFEMAAVNLSEDQGDFIVFISTAYYLFISIAILRSALRYKGSRLFIVWTQLTVLTLWVVVLWRIFGASGAMDGVTP